MRSLLACFVFVAACGARTGTSSPPPPPRTSPTPTPRATGPTEAECDELYAHAFALVIAERQPTDADRAALRTELRPGFVADCRGGTRDYYTCGRVATSRAALDACK